MKKLNRKLKLLVAGIATALVGVGCAKPAADAKLVTAALRMTGSSQPTTIAYNKNSHPLYRMLMPTAVAFAPPAMTDSGTRVIALNKAWITVKEVEFELDEVSGAAEIAGDDVKFSGPYFVDLLSSTPVSFGAAEVPAAVYRRVKMKLEKDSALPAGAPTQLAGKSMYFEGTVSGLAFSYAPADGSEYKIAGPGGVNLSDTANMMIGVKVADLFKMINMNAVAAAANRDISDGNRILATNPCPLIDSTVTDIFTCLRKGLEKAGKFGKDDDNDGEIEA